MIKKPLISIITPTYNHEDFIGDCIDSLLAQDYENWEQIIIDDGSTDSTEKIISKYKDKRIIYIKQKNKGIWNLHKNYNKALENSKGELIAILEGDDFWPPYKLSKQLIAFEDPEVVLSWGNAYVANKNGNIISTLIRDTFKPNKSIHGTLVLKKLLLNNFIPACTALCKKDALIKIGGFKQPENSPSVDKATWLHLAEEGKFYFVNEILGYWRTHEKQTTLNKSLEMITANGTYSAYFFNKLSQDKKDRIGIKIEDINNQNKLYLSEVYFNKGRFALYKKEWKISKKNFEKSFINGNFSYRLKSIIGIMFYYLRLDFEWIIKIINK